MSSTLASKTPNTSDIPLDRGLKFPPKEEASLLEQSNNLKSRANTCFKLTQYPEALTLYNESLSVCPQYLKYERAVIYSNIAACHLHTSEWKDAVTAASEALELLDPSTKKEPVTDATKKQATKSGVKDAKEEAANTEEEEEDEFVDASETPIKQDEEQEEEEADEEIISAGARKAETITDEATRQRLIDTERIRTKSLLRRAKARVEIGSWSALTGAEEDYKTLSTIASLSATDRKLVSTQLRLLPARTKKAQEVEMAEMMSKLKGVSYSCHFLRQNISRISSFMKLT